MSKQTFLKGAFILIIASFITKILGFVNRIVVARIMGSEGVGLYMMAIPTLLLVMTLTQLGLPVAISKLVAEAEAKKDSVRVKRVLVVSLSTTLGLTIIFTTLMIVLAPFVAANLLTDERAYYPLIAITPIVPIVAISAIIRGYFQGKQNMKPTAISQVIEQVVRITLVAITTTAFLPLGVEYAAAGAMISVVAGEFISLLYMVFVFKRRKSFRVRQQFFTYAKGGRKTFSDLMRIALPTTGSRLIGSVSLFFEPIVVAQSLALAGVATVMATKQYGELAGFAIPLLMLPTFITASLSVSLVPAISEAAAEKQYQLIHHRLTQALRLALLSGGISCVVLYIFAEQVVTLMYNAPNVAMYIKIMAPFSIFLYLQGPLQATLQALDLAKAAMMNSLFGALIKTTAIFALASRPELGIMGATLAVVIGFILVTLLHFATVVKTIGFTLEVRLVAKVILLIGSTAGFGVFCAKYITFTESMLIDTTLAICLTTAFYFILIFMLKLVHKHEIARLPMFGTLLSKFIR
ncbi:stage V sporulation protein B [Alkalihalobacillus alcalophilus ATCC 27647 = CGMCC 1.3604]|uniref:Polysaccharide export transporter n=1 Tax=Alkalihalobacillus alcalophilus ATCC 27647 = CGMCC 1.3604 TaxID=1218173 RepID=J8T5L7_ALKAL|nr:stage V sporulation protein B [Alkalihalobacillus alcalophilus]AFV25988.1 polysaccharide export transporter [Alkalihalobacillus alcalophilus ATCC 27647 = CGMCC 1.3604]KGA96507.1 stage V sporulation protein B [Alkalihalobacillus alcalophilus ATCC 27647 = CGMCC 1.3604]MED1561565.1 stage V sporulation protein B [Alkalihalobacillus alcalophilus]THG90548.1 stage V sporulation protein B [Alkalihalobacillus alcalophilus ATCC 27647 = CGMCC 1.3604]